MGVGWAQGTDVSEGNGWQWWVPYWQVSHAVVGEVELLEKAQPEHHLAAWQLLELVVAQVLSDEGGTKRRQIMSDKVWRKLCNRFIFLPASLVGSGFVEPSTLSSTPEGCSPAGDHSSRV